jgi:sugar lactone lactonase YvrE
MPLGSFRLNSIAKALAVIAPPPSSGTPWNLADASYESKFLSVTVSDTSNRAMYFKPDGTQVFVVGTSLDTVQVYTMTTAWDISTASTSPSDTNVKTVTAQESSPSGLYFKPDGTKMYIIGIGSTRLYSYTLSTPWLLTSATLDSSNLYVFSEEAGPSGLYFKPDGTKFYISGFTSGVAQYSMPTPWDLTSAFYESKSFSVASQESNPSGVFFKTDGSKMYVVGSSNDNVYEYSLSTAWDVTTSSYTNVAFSVVGQETTPQDLAFKPNGTKMYIIGSSQDRISQYNIASDPLPSVSISPTTIDEGENFVITSSGFDSYNGDNVYFKHYVNGVLLAPGPAPDFNYRDESVAVVDGSFSDPYISIKNDNLTEGPETYYFEVYADSGFTTLLATSNTATINDTSLTPPSPTSISVHTNVTAATTSITMPSTIIAGDLAVLFDTSTTTSSSITPSGWALINGVTTTGIRTNISRKLLTGTEGGSTITGMAGTTRKVLVIYRGNTAINSITTTLTGTQATTATPSNQSLVGEAGPMAAIAVYAKTAFTTPTRGWSVGSPTEYNRVSTSGIFVKSLITDSGTPATTTISMTDAGTNTLQSFRIKFS